MTVENHNDDDPRGSGSDTIVDAYFCPEAQLTCQACLSSDHAQPFFRSGPRKPLSLYELESNAVPILLAETLSCLTSCCVYSITEVRVGECPHPQRCSVPELSSLPSIYLSLPLKSVTSCEPPPPRRLFFSLFSTAGALSRDASDCCVYYSLKMNLALSL